MIYFISFYSIYKMLRQDGLDLLNVEREMFRRFGGKLDRILAKLDGVEQRLEHLEDANSMLKVCCVYVYMTPIVDHRYITRLTSI